MLCAAADLQPPFQALNELADETFKDEEPLVKRVRTHLGMLCCRAVNTPSWIRTAIMDSHLVMAIVSQRSESTVFQDFSQQP